MLTFLRYSICNIYKLFSEIFFLSLSLSCAYLLCVSLSDLTEKVSLPPPAPHPTTTTNSSGPGDGERGGGGATQDTQFWSGPRTVNIYKACVARERALKADMRTFTVVVGFNIACF